MCVGEAADVFYFFKNYPLRAAVRYDTIYAVFTPARVVKLADTYA